MLRSPDKWTDAFYGKGARALSKKMLDSKGVVTETDMRNYKVIEREPLSFSYNGHTIYSNPGPSVGGGLLKAALNKLEREGIGLKDGPQRVLTLARTMDYLNRMKNGTGGTTQISVIDSEGNAASMTSSNGSNSGCFLGDTGVMLNNMMGEDDLHPGGFHSEEPGQRVGSMMSPSIIISDDKVRAVLGSGGSKRIKTAMLQAIHNLLDRRMDMRQAVEAPRVHLDDEGILQVEPGFDKATLDALSEEFKINVWDHKDLYFGGVHAVTGSLAGWGDSRRDGAFKTVK
jgi:gamma-glutamyltranspeptidase/glutathione hydrolase